MEGHAHGRIQEWHLLQAEVTEFLGRARSQRRKRLKDVAEGYRNGYGNPRRVALGGQDYSAAAGDMAELFREPSVVFV